MDFETICVQGKATVYDKTGAVTVPIYQSATFAHPGIGQSTGFDYARLQNPTREALEQTVAALENGIDAMAFSTGMAAITMMMELLKPGDHILSSDDLYGGTYRLFDHISRKNGIEVDFVDMREIETVRKAVRGNTKLILAETPTNPMMHVADLRALAALCKEQGILLAVDNTFLTPYFQKPLDLGADIVIHSGTKYLGGHNDTLAGFLVVKDETLSERLRYLFKTTGACLAPLDSWLLLRGIKTLAVRMDRQQETAGELARWLKEQNHVNAVHYVGLPEHPGYAVSKSQASGFGAMISFEVDTKETAERVLERIRVIRFAESLGGVDTLMTYPMMQTHGDMPEAFREGLGINAKLLRLSVGLESPKDLKEDLLQALEG